MVTEITFIHHSFLVTKCFQTMIKPFWVETKKIKCEISGPWMAEIFQALNEFLKKMPKTFGNQIFGHSIGCG